WPRPAPHSRAVATPTPAPASGRSRRSPVKRTTAPITLGGICMLLDQNKFVVKSESKGFSDKKAFEILDPESGQVLGTAKDTTGKMLILGATIAVETIFKKKKGGKAGGDEGDGGGGGDDE